MSEKDTDFEIETKERISNLEDNLQKCGVKWDFRLDEQHGFIAELKRKLNNHITRIHHLNTVIVEEINELKEKVGGKDFNDPCQPCKEEVECDDCGHYPFKWSDKYKIPYYDSGNRLCPICKGMLITNVDNIFICHQCGKHFREYFMEVEGE